MAKSANKVMGEEPMMDNPGELTPDLVERIKAYLVQQGLPPVVYKATFEQDTFIFRPLYRVDWVQLQSFQESNPNVRLDIINQKICERALLYPGEILDPIHWDMQRAGYQQTLAQHISAKSGFIDPELDGAQGFFVEPITTTEPHSRPDQEVIDTLKRGHRWNLTLVSLLGEYFVVRPLNRTEWKSLVGQANSPDFELKVAERGTIWSSADGYVDGANPANFNDKLAGVPKTVAGIIMETSGFSQQPVVEAL